MLLWQQTKIYSIKSVVALAGLIKRFLDVPQPCSRGWVTYSLQLARLDGRGWVLVALRIGSRGFVSRLRYTFFWMWHIFTRIWPSVVFVGYSGFLCVLYVVLCVCVNRFDGLHLISSENDTSWWLLENQTMITWLSPYDHGIPCDWRGYRHMTVVYHVTREREKEGILCEVMPEKETEYNY